MKKTIYGAASAAVALALILSVSDAQALGNALAGGLEHRLRGIAEDDAHHDVGTVHGNVLDALARHIVDAGVGVHERLQLRLDMLLGDRHGWLLCAGCADIGSAAVRVVRALLLDKAGK